MDMAETPGAYQPGPYNTQSSSVESRQLVSGQSSEMPTWKQRVMASAHCSTHETACTQNSTAHPGKVTDFYSGGPSETASFIQQVVSAEQKSSPAGSHLMKFISTTKSCLPHPQKTAVSSGTKRTTSSEEDNLVWHPETSLSSEETFFLDRMRTSVDQNVYPSHNGTLKIEESLEPQVISLSNQAPYVGESSDTSSSPLIQIQPQEISSASGLDQGQYPEIKLDLKIQSLVSPKKAHTSKRYCCTYQGCKKSYKMSHHLKDHMQKHTGEKLYMCNKPGCNWKFFRLVDLNRHKQKHSGVRPYPCPMCNKNYSRSSYLKQHLKSHIQASPTTST